MASITGLEFEDYVWKNGWLRRFPPSEGWNSESQKRLSGGFTVDFTACQGNSRAVGDAKDKASLTPDDVEKLILDGGIYKAQRLLLFVAADTRISEGVLDYAEDNDVEIVSTRWRS